MRDCRDNKTYLAHVLGKGAVYGLMTIKPCFSDREVGFCVLWVYMGRDDLSRHSLEDNLSKDSLGLEYTLIDQHSKSQKAWEVKPQM